MSDDHLRLVWRRRVLFATAVLVVLIGLIAAAVWSTSGSDSPTARAAPLGAGVGNAASSTTTPPQTLADPRSNELLQKMATVPSSSSVVNGNRCNTRGGSYPLGSSFGCQAAVDRMYGVGQPVCSLAVCSALRSIDITMYEFGDASSAASFQAATVTAERQFLRQTRDPATITDISGSVTLVDDVLNGVPVVTSGYFSLGNRFVEITLLTQSGVTPDNEAYLAQLMEQQAQLLRS